MKKANIAIIAALIGTAGLVYAWNDVRADTLNEFTTSALSAKHLRGRTLLLTDGTNGETENAFGYAYYGGQILNGNESVIYPSASLQKAMTGAMITQLINETQKSTNPITQYTKISRWYPNLNKASDITLGNLMTQTSGIYDGSSETDPGRVLSEDEAVNQAVERINHVGVRTQGSFHYNNDNYILLAGIIRQQTGKSYAENIQSRIIGRMNMQNTYMWANVPNSRVKAVSYQYKNGKNYQDGKRPTDSLLSYIVGAGNLYTTPADYYKFQRGLHDGQILNAGDYGYMTGLKTKTSADYSGGLYVKNAGKIKMVYGSLDADHYSNWVQLTAGNKLGIIMFLNQVPDNSVATTVKSVGFDILNKIKPNTFVPSN